MTERYEKLSFYVDIVKIYWAKKPVFRLSIRKMRKYLATFYINKRFFMQRIKCKWRLITSDDVPTSEQQYTVFYLIL